MRAVSAFREEYVSLDLDDPQEFTDVQARRVRYAIYWSMYENTAYRNIHTWGQSYRMKFGLYKYIRNIYNPAYRLGEFWSTHLMGGMLDPAAGDGKTAESCLPIVIPDTNQTNEQRLRAAIAALWKASNWQTNKDIYTLWGSVMGDTALRVIDDPEHSKVYLEVIHPKDLCEIVRDARGNVKYYKIERPSTNPTNGKACVYCETGENLGGGVIEYHTYMDDKEYAWDGENSSWTEDYGFIPLVTCQHHNVGLDFGWSEIHPVRSKMHEADDIASALSDHIRKAVNAPFLLAGVSPPSSGRSTTTTMINSDATNKRPEVGREESQFLYTGEAGAHADSLLHNLDYTGVNVHLVGILTEIEREFPELRFDNARVSGDASGKALRVARQPAEAKVKARRANYDDALKHALQMAISIGGMRGYEGYQGFGLESYQAGALDFSIGDRPVFGVDELERLEEDTAFWAAAAAAVQAGAALDGYLRRQGWSEEDITQIVQGKTFSEMEQ